MLSRTYLNRTCSDLPCTAVFANEEWQPTWRVGHKSEAPAIPPRLAEFMKVITHLGGNNNCVLERVAGPQPIWIGVCRMLDYPTTWLAFSNPKDVCK